MIMAHKVSHEFKSGISFAVNGKPASPAKFREALLTLRGMKYQGEFEYDECGRLVKKR